MTKIIRSFVFIAMFLFIAPLGACAATPPPEKLLIGEWEANAVVADIQVMAFREDGTCTFGPFGDAFSGVYTVTRGDKDVPDTLTINYDALLIRVTDTYTFTVSATQLDLKKKDASLALSLRRRATSPETTQTA
jgi:hypothetical protein